jgi:hypothetical protein
VGREQQRWRSCGHKAQRGVMGDEHTSNIQKIMRWGGKSSLNLPIFALHQKTIDGFLDT